MVTAATQQCLRSLLILTSTHTAREIQRARATAHFTHHLTPDLPVLQDGQSQPAPSTCSTASYSSPSSTESHSCQPAVYKEK